MILHSTIIGLGKPLIILHGFLGMGDNWKTLAKQFSKQGYEIHLVDQRNHGKSFRSKHFNYALMAEDLKSYYFDKNIDKAIVLGHSMGGKTAMYFACMYPNLVEELIIADISPRYYPMRQDWILNGLSQLDFSVIKTRAQADSMLSKYISEKGLRQFLLKNLYWVEKGKLDLRINLQSLTTNLAKVGEALPNHLFYTKSTIFLRGDRSEYIGDSDTTIIYQHFPKAQIKTIDKAGHWLHAEKPIVFFNEVMQFLKHKPKDNDQ